MFDWSTRWPLVMQFVFLLPAACRAVVLLLDLTSSIRTRTGNLFLLIVAVVDPRAARIMTVADFRPRHSLFVGVLTTLFLN